MRGGSKPFSQSTYCRAVEKYPAGLRGPAAIVAIQPYYSQHWSKIKLKIGLIGISLGESPRQPGIVPVDVVVEIHEAVFIHSCSAVQDQHRNW